VAGDFYDYTIADDQQGALCDLLTQTRQLTPAMAADAIVSEVRRWSERQDDDLTVFICDYVPQMDEVLDLLAPR
jgi:hypothetical protein